MPNGEGHDSRPLWQRVKDMQRRLDEEKEENQQLRKTVERVKAERDALIESLRLVKGDES